jgi:hypothetical protein
MALRPPKTAQTTPVPAAVPSSTRLDCVHIFGLALGRRLSSGRPGGHPVFLMSGASGRAAAAFRDRRGVAEPAQLAALTTARSRLCAALAEQASAGSHVPAPAPRMKRSWPIRSHGQ